MIGRSSIKRIKAALHAEGPDIIFLQEVVGDKIRTFFRRKTKIIPQHQFIAERGWEYSVYYENRTHSAGHHGNALISRFPILTHGNVDVSAYSFEKRGILSAVIELPNNSQVYCFCLHLALLTKGRLKQVDRLVALIKDTVPADAPLIIAGDFNDWKEQSTPILEKALNVQEACQINNGKHAKSFPRLLPVLRLDRIYFRGLIAESASVIPLPGSDHCALKATFTSIA